MGTPREYGFNDTLKENILKADPLSSFTVTPFSRQVVLWWREGSHNTSLKPTVLSSRPDPATLVSVWTHVSCLDEGWMLSTVLECIGTAGGAGMPALALLSPSVSLCFKSSSLFSTQIKNKHHSISSWSDPEVVVTHICFLGCLTWEQSKEKKD